MVEMRLEYATLPLELLIDPISQLDKIKNLVIMRSAWFIIRMKTMRGTWREFLVIQPDYYFLFILFLLPSKAETGEDP